MLRTKTPLPTKHWPFISKGNGKGISCPSPHTPKAPRRVHAIILVTKFLTLKCDRLLQSSFRSQHFLKGAFCLRVCPSLYVNHFHLIELYFVRMSYASLSLSLSLSQTIELTIF
ncbi:hypothetical protein GIB67_040354 [Kingdonia uniflora]|uniref:Uncharacterized protein n=1 Tax=Kingdonia uniflora TaxID=39325 RepID=A0A7J7L984_9MAGN|nr:hypothetical protein GIB67_040354 [Kingdonia uniflora]